MIKWPEPFLVKHEDICGDEVGPPSRCYTEAQLKQAVRDAYEEAAKVAQETVCDTHIPTGVNIYGTRAAKAIRALIKEIEACVK